MLRWILLLALMLLIPLAQAAEEAKSSYRPYSDIPAEIQTKLRKTPALARINVSTFTVLTYNDITKTDLLVINPRGVLMVGHPDSKYIVIAAKKVVFEQQFDPMYRGLNVPMDRACIEVRAGGSRLRIAAASDDFGTSSLNTKRLEPRDPAYQKMLDAAPRTPPALYLFFDELQLPEGFGPGPCFHISSIGVDGAPGGDIWLIGPDAVFNGPHGVESGWQSIYHRNSKSNQGNPSSEDWIPGNIYRVKTD